MQRINIILTYQIETLRERFINDVLDLIGQRTDERIVMSDVADEMRGGGWRFGCLADLEMVLTATGFSIAPEKNYRGQMARFVRV